MILTVCGGGLKATTKDHGLTEYWAHRLTICSAPAQFPRLFCWVYRHEGRRLRHELRCHAVLCPSAAVAKQIESELKESLALALLEFKRDKISRQNARLSLVNSVYDNPTIPRRKILLSTGQSNYRPPLERSKSAPKLCSIEEIVEEEEDPKSRTTHKKVLKHYDSTSALLDKRKSILESYIPKTQMTVPADICDETKMKDREPRVTFNDDIINIDDRSDVILEELVQSSLSNDLLESCERAWINALGETPDLIPVDSDEGSLSSGCESASTVTSDMDQPAFPLEEIVEETVEETPNEKCKTENKKTDLDFKVGGSVLARVRSFERIANTDILKYCGLNNNLYNNKSLLNHEEVSLIPVGESHTDFSSLKVFKKKTVPERDISAFEVDETDGNGSEEENGSACSDESGYEEEEIASSVSNIVLV